MVVNNLDIVVNAMFQCSVPLLQNYNYNYIMFSIKPFNGDNRGLKRLERIKVRNVLNILSRLKRLAFLVGEFTRFSCL